MKTIRFGILQNIGNGKKKKKEICLKKAVLKFGVKQRKANAKYLKGTAMLYYNFLAHQVNCLY